MRGERGEGSGVEWSGVEWSGVVVVVVVVVDVFTSGDVDADANPGVDGAVDEDEHLA